MKLGLIAGSILLIAAALSTGAFGNLAQAPASASQQKNPYAGKRSAVGAGSALYRQNCSMCHGEDARGSGNAVTLRSPKTHSASDGRLFWVITHGDPEKGMPAFERISAEERWQIVTYLKSLSIAKANP